MGNMYEILFQYIKKQTKINDKIVIENLPEDVKIELKKDISQYIDKNNYIYLAGNIRNIYNEYPKSNYLIKLLNKYPMIISVNYVWNLYIKNNNNILECTFWNDSDRYEIYCYQFKK